MKITDLLSSKTVVLNATAKDKNEIIKKAIATIKNSGAISNVNEYSKLVYAREEKSTTGVGDGIAIPHAKSKAVKKPALAALVIRKGVDYKSLDGEKVNLLFLIAAPDSKDNVHLDVLARLSNLLMHPEFKEALLKAKSAKEFMKAIDSSEELFLGSNEPKKESKSTGYEYLAVTACPTGIAHTFMAEEALKKAAEKLKVSIKVETNGQAGVKNKLTDEEIKNAKAIIVGADVGVELDRFNGKKTTVVSVSKVIKDAEMLIKQAETAQPYKAKGGFIKTKEQRNAQEGKFHTIYKHLMNGVSHMIPLVVGGGILIAIAFLIDMASGVTPGPDFGTVTIGARIFKTIGGFAFNLMLPILAGFIAFSISGRPGLVIGLAGGVAASSGGFNLLYWIGDDATKAKLEGVNAGFLGAIIAGFLAGYVVKLLEKATNKVPKSLDGLRPILIYPLFGILIIGLVMFLVNIPLSYVNIGLNEGLTKLNEMKLDILLGALVAMMMATDMGGPINKAAYVFATGLLAQSSADINHQHIMAAVMLGGMVPPLAIALSAALFPQKYSKDDRRNAPVTAVMGAGFITEGVIPYAAKDPWRVILSCMIGSAAGGALSVWWDCKLPAPHGGVFVFPVMAQSAGFYVLAIIIGTVVSTLMLGILKKDVNDELGKWKGISFRRVGHRIAGVFKKK
ncbi:MAG: fructose-specific PTS transporter subunit EIIC [Bacilli bacterium]|nr:fructose-specific PTS transporter subunit EIIC [Bacilli bacterium]